MPLIKHLQQHIRHLSGCLLALVEQHHLVGTSPHGLGELTALLVADVAGRRADQPGHAVSLHVLAHIDANHGIGIVEQEFGESLGQLGLNTTEKKKTNKQRDGERRQ